MNKYFNNSVLLFFIILLIPLINATAIASSDMGITKFNAGWKFFREDEGKTVAETPPVDSSYDDSQWENITLPHTARIEPVFADKHFQGIVWYRKHFLIDPKNKDKKVYIKFDAAMQSAEVWINGKRKMKHLGGYLPFIVDITAEILFDRDNVITLKLDNRNNPDFPPGKPLDQLDFCYFGGLYRDAWLRIADRIHVSDPVAANKVAGGGVFVTFENVSDESATVRIKTDVVNDSKRIEIVEVVSSLLDGNSALQSVSSIHEVEPGADFDFKQDIAVKKPRLWSPDSPNLYTLRTELRVAGELKDVVYTRIGIRSISFVSGKGFFINGNKMRLLGTNRHQEYPYIGNAIPDNAQYRDAYKLKSAGFNIVRMSHYPQSPAFLDACDELGLMVIVATPGWQFYNISPQFGKAAIQNIRDMIRRDRNHPSVALWEVALNETSAAPDEFYRKSHLAAHAEYPGDQMFTCGDTDGRQNPASIGFDVPFAQWDEKNFSRGIFSIPGKWGYPREYGDFEFGGNESSSRAFRGDGEKAMLTQAWNFQWSHNRNLSAPNLYGDGMWVGIDYNRGYYPLKPICACGALDIFRLPKFVYYFYASQLNPRVISPDFESGPMVYIANHWTPRKSPAKVVVYSNAEEIELFVNGKSTGRSKPDSGPDTKYESEIQSNPNYWSAPDKLQKYSPELAKIATSGPPTPKDADSFNGGNTRNLDHAPFTFMNVPYADGEIKAVAYIGEKSVATHTRKTPGAPVAIRLQTDISGKPLTADGADVIFVRAEVIDSNGTVSPNSDANITFEVSGPCSLVGENPVSAEAGIASILLRAGSNPGEIKIIATSPSLKQADATIESLLSENIE